MAENTKTRKSLELENGDWQTLDELAKTTQSLSKSNNEYGGQPSWRVLVERVAKSERCKVVIGEALYQDHLDEIIFNWRNLFSELPDKEVSRWESSLSEEDKAKWQEFLISHPQEQDEIKWHVAHNLAYRRSREEAIRLGYQPDPEILFNNTTAVLIDQAKGLEAGQALIKKWGFDSPSTPNTMWDVMAYRRDGDALIALVGDDRGWDKDWEYYVVVAWSPYWLVRNDKELEMWALL